MIAFLGARGRPVREAFAQAPDKIRNVQPGTLRRKLGVVRCGFWEKWDEKKAFFEKRTGEVIENK